MIRETFKSGSKVICFIDIEKPIPGLDRGSVRVWKGAPSGRISNRHYWTFDGAAYDAAREKALSLFDEAGFARDSAVIRRYRR